MQLPEREPWQVSGPGPFLTVGEVGVRALGGDRYLIAWPDGEQIIEGFDRARELAHELAAGRAAVRRS